MILRWFFSILLLVLAGYILYFLLMPSSTALKLQTANEAYIQGMQAKTVYERKSLLNEALALYSELEEETNPALGNGNLYQHLGNIYYELESYPFALLYYYRAQQLDPLNASVQEGIARAREKLQLSQIDEPSVFENLFFFYHYYPLPKRLQLLFIFGVGAVILGSGAFWLRQRWLAWAASVTAVLCLIFTLGVLFTRYVEPIEGVLIKASLLTREVGNSDDWATETPTPSGTRVKIVDLLEGGAWLKVTTPDGTLGFTTADRIRII